MPIKPIRNARDHDKALREIERLWGAPEGSPRGDRLDVLIALADAYERLNHPMDPPDPINAMRVRINKVSRSVL
jgi:HTH-type transcriptional regulator/antitoxin HigA